MSGQTLLRNNELQPQRSEKAGVVLLFPLSIVLPPSATVSANSSNHITVTAEGVPRHFSCLETLSISRASSPLVCVESPTSNGWGSRPRAACVFFRSNPILPNSQALKNSSPHSPGYIRRTWLCRSGNRSDAASDSLRAIALANTGPLNLNVQVVGPANSLSRGHAQAPIFSETKGTPRFLALIAPKPGPLPFVVCAHAGQRRVCGLELDRSGPKM